MIKICHIAPMSVMRPFEQYCGAHLLLAHLVEESEDYASFYRRQNKCKILDNSAFEMFKQGKPMYPSDKLLELGQLVKAEYIVMSDYPTEPGKKTIDAAKQLAPIFKENSFKTFFVPQSKKGDLKDYLKTFEWALNSDLVDMIGVSILGAPLALGCLDSQLQRYLARIHMMKILVKHGILDQYNHRKKLHFLGALDGWPGELQMVMDNNFDGYINSWDSSQAIWHGMLGISYDNSPTGLIKGKDETPVDFNAPRGSCKNIQIATANVKVVNTIAA